MVKWKVKEYKKVRENSEWERGSREEKRKEVGGMGKKSQLHPKTLS